jgi:hypothetical protein
VVIAAEQYAARMVLPASQRTCRQQWGSHNNLAAKALKKLVSPHLPASLKQLEKAVAAANKHAKETQNAQRATTTREPPAGTDPPPLTSNRAASSRVRPSTTTWTSTRTAGCQRPPDPPADTLGVPVMNAAGTLRAVEPAARAPRPGSRRVLRPSAGLEDPSATDPFARNGCC